MKLATIQSRCRSGFTLIELLSVIAVMMLLLVGGLVGGGNLIRERRIDDAGRILIAEIEYARQLAVSRNRNAEVRFFRAARYAGQAESYHRIQVGLIDKDGVFQPEGKRIALPEGIILSAREALSPVIHTLHGGTGGYVSLIIRPTGFLQPQPGMPLGADWFITAIRENDEATEIAEIPNFATISIDPWTGRTQLYRP